MRTTVKAIVLNIENEVLLLNDRNNYYDLPGGGVDEGETLEDACVRELGEETSYNSFEIAGKLPNQYFYYLQNNSNLKSIMHCFVVKLLDETKASELEPNTSEEWVGATNVLSFFENKDTPRHQAMKDSIRDFNCWYQNTILGPRVS